MPIRFLQHRARVFYRRLYFLGWFAIALATASVVSAQTVSRASEDPSDQGTSQSQATPVTVACSSKAGGDRTTCQADTSKGVVLLRTTGDAPCLLGKTWGYDQTSVWVSDGCSAEFRTGAGAEPEPDSTKPKPLSHIPNVGFLIVDSDKGTVYLRLFSYGRYLNQRNLDPTYVDA